ncbi:MAG: MFS transporter [Chloroflexi bacterium]|nr:MFS transporter [Chloroflexota bacterium]
MTQNAVSTAAEEFHRRRWYALLILSLSLTLVIMDATIVNVAIPSIVDDFEGATFRDAEWVNTIYSLVYAATLILWGKIGDQYGRRLLFLIGVVLFGLGSALVGASTSIGMLIGMRALQGLGAAILSPSTLSIITTAFKGKERGIAFGIWGATAGVAAALGPLVGGYVIDNASWRWAFYINIPIVTVAFFGAMWAIQESRDTGTRHYFDVPGTLLGGLGLAALVFGIIEAQEYGWWKPDAQFEVLGWEWPLESLSIAPVSMMLGAALLAIFTWYELRLERRNMEPLFEFGLLRFLSYRYGMITGLIVNLGEIGLLFAASLWLQGTKGLTAFETGVALLPLAIMAFIGAPLAGAFSNRIGPKWIVTAGMVIEAITLLILGLVLEPDISVNVVALLLGVYGLGLGLAIAQLTSLVLFDIPGPKAGVASGGNSTIRQVGAALGIAIIGTVLATTNERITEDEFADSSEVQAVFAMMSSGDGAHAGASGSPQGIPQDTAQMPPNVQPDDDSAAGPPAGMPSAGMPSADMPVPDMQTTEPGAAPAGPPAGMGDMSAMPEGMPDMSETEPAEAFSEMAKQPVHFEFEEMFGATTGEEFDRIFALARTEAMANAALVAFLFIGIGAISSLMLPNPKDDPEDTTTH